MIFETLHIYKKFSSRSLSVLFILFSSILIGQHGNGENKKAWFHFDNDLFFKTDYYYTNGLELGLTHPIVKKSPFRAIMFRNRNEHIEFHSVSITQEMYTPEDLSVDETQYDDRPYAGALFLTQSKQILDSTNLWNIESSFSIGVLGPLAGTSQVQSYIHRITPSGDPEGWETQVNNTVIINYATKIEKGIIASKWFNFNTYGTARLGSYKTNASIGTFFRLGKSNNYFSSLDIHKNNKGFLYFIEGEIQGNLILYDATLRNFNTARIPLGPTYNDIKTWTATGFLKAHISYGNWAVQGRVTYKTPEFETGKSHMFFRLSLIKGF